MRHLPIVILLLLTAWSPLEGADAAAPADRDAYALVLLAPSRPVFLRMAVQVDGQSLKSLRRAHAERMVREFDANSDGALDKDEAQKLPALVKSGGMREVQSVVESWVSVDRNPADDRVTSEELGDWFDRVLGASFSLAARPQRATQNVDLFGMLDLDRDGRISADEFRRAGQSLYQRDLDEDETYTIDELSPVPIAPGQVAVQNRTDASADQPFLLLAEDQIASVAEQILRRYAADASQQSLPVSLFNTEQDGAARFDADGDGRLSLVELQALLRDPPQHLELAAALQLKRSGRPKLEVEANRLGAASIAAGKLSDRTTLGIHGITVEMRLQSNRGARSDNRNFYQIAFLRADADKNKYLDEQEFAGLQIPDATFAQVDRNGDGMLTTDELQNFIDQDSDASQSRVVMTISHNEKSVFELLDVNSDRRLSFRELRGAVERMHGFDRDGDGQVSTVELAGRFQVVLELGKPLFRRVDQQNRGDAMQTAPVVNRPMDGPEWFRKMDRNRDGDLSRREFLGSPAKFRTLDRDGDGLITAAEAQAAEPAPTSADSGPAEQSQGEEK